MAISEQELVRILLADRAKILGFIRSIVRRRDLAEDVFQEISMRAVEKRETLRSQAHLQGWLRKAARLEAMNLRRREQVRAPAFSDGVLDLLEVNWQQHDEDDGPALAEFLRQCLDQLSPGARDLVRHRYEEGLSTATLAQKLNRPAASLYVSFCRIHAALADCIYKKLGQPEGHDA